MAKIENTAEHPYDVSGLPKDGKPGGLYSFPRCTFTPEGVKINGQGEIPDDVLADLLENDVWTKGVFASGDLVNVGSKVGSRSVGIPTA